MKSPEKGRKSRWFGIALSAAAVLFMARGGAQGDVLQPDC
jgi:hypothetical protein